MDYHINPTDKKKNKSASHRILIQFEELDDQWMAAQYRSWFISLPSITIAHYFLSIGNNNCVHSNCITTLPFNINIGMHTRAKLGYVHATRRIYYFYTWISMLCKPMYQVAYNTWMQGKVTYSSCISRLCITCEYKNQRRVNWKQYRLFWRKYIHNELTFPNQ